MRISGGRAIRRGCLIAAGLLVQAISGVSFAAEPARVRVDADVTLATVGPGAVGLDIWYPNPHGVDAEAVRLYREAGVQAFGYDGGPAVDLYDWRTNTLKAYPYPDERAEANFATTSGRMGTFAEVLQPKVSFDDFGKLVRSMGARGRAHVNYGTGDPQEAAAWVAHARRKGYPIDYWEVGQYLSGNGTLNGSGNEPDAHADKSAEFYARSALEFIRAMKAANPAIKVGLHLHMSTRPGSPGWKWNDTVLKIAAPHIDFVDVWAFPYPPGNDVQVLQYPTLNTRNWAAAYKRLLAKHARPGQHIELIVGETLFDVSGGPRNLSLAAALFLPDQYLSLFEQGVARVDWAFSHLGPVPRFWYSWQWLKRREVKDVPQTDAGYGEYGILSSGDCDSWTNVCQPPANTPFAPYFGLKILAALAVPGAQLLATTSSDPLTAIHAARLPGGTIAILLINKDPDSIRTVQLDLRKFTAGPRATVLYYGQGSRDVDRREADVDLHEPITLPPWSLTVLVLERSAIP